MFTNYNLRSLIATFVFFNILVLKDAFAVAAPLRRTQGSITASQILKFAPDAKTCDKSAQYANECRTATQAAPLIDASFKKYGVNSTGEQAALLSLMSFETGHFKFDRNHQNAGQGTRNLMTFPFVLQYAQDIKSTKSKVKSFVSLSKSPSSVSSSNKNKVMNLVLSDSLSFASAAWYYKKSGQCDSSVTKGLKAGTESGWENFITNCVGTTVTDDRKKEYKAVLAALKSD